MTEAVTAICHPLAHLRAIPTKGMNESGEKGSVCWFAPFDSNRVLGSLTLSPLLLSHSEKEGLSPPWATMDSSLLTCRHLRFWSGGRDVPMGRAPSPLQASPRVQNLLVLATLLHQQGRNSGEQEPDRPENYPKNEQKAKVTAAVALRLLWFLSGGEGAGSVRGLRSVHAVTEEGALLSFPVRPLLGLPRCLRSPLRLAPIFALGLPAFTPSGTLMFLMSEIGTLSLSLRTRRFTKTLAGQGHTACLHGCLGLTFPTLQSDG